MPRVPKKLYTDYEKLLLKNILLYSKRIQRLYNNAIVEVSLSSSTIKYTGEIFTLDLYPAIRIKIDSVLREMQKEMLATINQATKDAWDLSNKKNDIITKAVLGKKALPSESIKNLFDPNYQAYEAFIKRKDYNLNLAKRIWKTIEPLKHELEAGLADGISKGRSAASLATDLKKYLKEPDKLFRRVRGADGKLRLSRAARAYNPGKGVYRSSFKNALRLTRTEINMSYHNADYERWLKNPAVLGIEIRLSNNHPKYDICDPLAGIYPKEFNWAGWHPQCLCFAIPVLVNEEQYSQIEDEILGIPTEKPVAINYVSEMPSSFQEYINNNRERIKGWKNLPLWATVNKDLVNI